MRRKTKPLPAGLFRLGRLLISNVYVVDCGPGARYVVDTGHRLERARLLAGLRSTGLFPEQITAVVLTHRHSDHAGNAAFLRKRWRIPVAAHAADAAVLDGSHAKPPLRCGSLNPFTRACCHIENRSRTTTAVDQILHGGQQLGDLEVHHAPGHTRGSLLLRHVGTRSLLSGDALLAAVPPLTIVQGITLPHPDYSQDYQQALASLRDFHEQGHQYDNLLAGHGKPVLGDAKRRAEDLLLSRDTS